MGGGRKKGEEGNRNEKKKKTKRQKDRKTGRKKGQNKVAREGRIKSLHIELYSLRVSKTRSHQEQ